MSPFSSDSGLTFPLNHSPLQKRHLLSKPVLLFAFAITLNTVVFLWSRALFSGFFNRLKKPEFREMSGAAGVWGWCRPHFAGVPNLVAQLCSGFLCKSLLSLGIVPRLENRSMAIVLQIPISFVNYRWRPTLFHQWIMGWEISSRPETERFKDAIRRESCK